MRTCRARPGHEREASKGGYQIIRTQRNVGDAPCIQRASSRGIRSIADVECDTGAVSARPGHHQLDRLRIGLSSRLPAAAHSREDSPSGKQDDRRNDGMDEGELDGDGVGHGGYSDGWGSAAGGRGVVVGGGRETKEDGSDEFENQIRVGRLNSANLVSSNNRSGFVYWALRRRSQGYRSRLDEVWYGFLF